MATDMEASMFIMFTTCLTCMCMCAWDTPTPNGCHTNPHPHPPICHPSGGTPGISQNSITLELIKIFQFHLKI